MNSNSDSGFEVTVLHGDHGVTSETINWALSRVVPPEGGFFLNTLELPEGHAILQSGIYGPIVGDLPVPDSDVTLVQRTPDRPLSRMVRRPARPTRLLTIIGTADGHKVTVFTAYGGPCAPREPGDKSLGSEEEKAEASAFWAQHALAL